MSTEAPVYYDGQRYREGEGRVRKIARALEMLPSTMMYSSDEVKALLEEAVDATVEAAEAVLVPLTEEDAANRGGVGRESDLATDKSAFKKFPDLFKDASST